MSTTITTKIAWISRHNLTAKQEELLERVHGSYKKVCNYRPHFSSPSNASNYVRQLINNGYEVYMSPVPEFILQELKQSGVTFRYFDGYTDDNNCYQANGIIEVQGSTEIIII